MAKSNPDTIILQGGEERNRKNDAQVVNSGITPGKLIEKIDVDTSGAKDTFAVQPHQTDDEKTAPHVALEYAKGGRGIDDDYSVDDHVEYYTAQDGDELYMFIAGGEDLTTSANADVSAGDTLGPDGNGNLRDGVTAGNEMFQANENISNANTSSANRIRVERI